MSADLPPSRALKRTWGGNKQGANISVERGNKQHTASRLSSENSANSMCLRLQQPSPRKCPDNFSHCSAAGDPQPAEGGSQTPTQPRSWQMSHTSSTGSVCFLFTFLHPAVLELLSPPRQSARTHEETDVDSTRMDVWTPAPTLQFSISPHVVHWAVWEDISRW